MTQKAKMSATTATFHIPDNVTNICEVLHKNGEQGYLVGGSLRDLMLGKTPDDWDLATTATPDKMRTLFRKVIPTGIEHGTVTVLIGRETYEITTLRAETGYADGRHPDSVKFVTDIIDDLSRRDFTVNAIAWNPLTEELFDPFNGKKDLRDGKVVAVGDALARFEEDGLRIMRAARFAATLQFEIEPSTESAIAQTAHRLGNVSVERKRDEFLKLLMADIPSMGLRTLLKNHLFRYICPAFDDFRTASDWPPVLDLVDALPAIPHLRLAGLWIGGGFDAMEQWLNGFLIERRTRKHVLHLHPFQAFEYNENWSDFDVRALASSVGREYMADYLKLLAALVKAGAVSESRAASFRQHLETAQWESCAMTVSELSVSGADLMRHLNIPPGPQIGVLLRQLLTHVLIAPSKNQPDILLALAGELIML